MRFFGKLLSSAAIGAVFVSHVTVAFARTPNDPLYGEQWYLKMIQAETAWDTAVGDGSVTVAVLDTGVDLDHPDLVSNLWTNTKEIPGNGVDDDHNGFVDDVHGWDFVDGDSDPTPDGGHASANSSALALSHGTLISGIIGAETNNGIGYAGINWRVKIMPVRILDEQGGGGETAAVNAIRYAVKNGARVINLSFVGDESSPALEAAVKDAYHAGVVIVAALGNDGKDVNQAPVYPACYRSPSEDWVIGVTATDENDFETEFTNFGNSCADLAAPGTNIEGLSLSNGSDGLTGEQTAWDGTSAAAPMVTGAAALMLSAFPALTPDDVRTALKLSVDPLKETISGRGALGVGRLNIARALITAQAIAGTAPQTPILPAPAPVSPVPAPSEPAPTNGSYSFIALGAAPSETPSVKVYRADGTPYAEFLAFAPGFLGGVRVSLEDIDQDGIPEVIASAGEGGGPQVRIFTAQGTLLHSFFAFDPKSRHGVSVALGDIDGDYYPDIVAVVGSGVSSDAVVYSLDGVEKFRFPVTGYPAGTPLTVTVADVDDDYDAEMVFAPLHGAPKVSVYDNNGKPLVDFMAFGESVTNGLTISAGDFDGDDRDEIVVGQRSPGTSEIRIFNKIGALWGSFFAGDEKFRGGENVSVSDMDVDGKPDITVSPNAESGDVEIFSPHGGIIGTVGRALVGVHGGSLAAW